MQPESSEAYLSLQDAQHIEDYHTLIITKINWHKTGLVNVQPSIFSLAECLSIGPKRIYNTCFWNLETNERR